MYLYSCTTTRVVVQRLYSARKMVKMKIVRIWAGLDVLGGEEGLWSRSRWDEVEKWKKIVMT
jgi:hypothetical protein